MNISANPDKVVDSLLNQIARLSKELAFNQALVKELQEKIEELEENAE